jgi:hypothetical protein
MRLNRERIAAGLSLLLLVIGGYQMVNARLLRPKPREIDTTIPASAGEIPRIEPRLFVDEGGGRNPFQVATDWAPMAPEPLDAPPLDPTRWIGLSLGRGPDPEALGFAYLDAPPQEVKTAESDDEKAPSGSTAETPTAAEKGPAEKSAAAEDGPGEAAKKTQKAVAPKELRSREPKAGGTAGKRSPTLPTAGGGARR